MCHVPSVDRPEYLFWFLANKITFYGSTNELLLNFGSSKTIFSSYHTNLVFFKVFNQYSRNPIEVTSSICVIANKWLNWFSSWFFWVKPANSVRSPQYKFSTSFGFFTTVSEIQTAAF
jgi:hypothetical protein